MNSFLTGATGSVGNGIAQALSLAGHTVMRFFVLYDQVTEEKKPMARWLLWLLLFGFRLLAQRTMAVMSTPQAGNTKDDQVRVKRRRFLKGAADLGVGLAGAAFVGARTALTIASPPDGEGDDIPLEPSFIATLYFLLMWILFKFIYPIHTVAQLLSTSYSSTLPPPDVTIEQVDADGVPAQRMLVPGGICVTVGGGLYQIDSIKSADLDTLLKAHGLTWKRDVSARNIEDDKRRFPLKDIAYSSAEVPIDLDTLCITNNKRVLAASIFADVSGFTKYIDTAQSAQEKVTALRVLHAVRKELARVIKYDFGGLRIQYQGDRVQGLFHLPQDNEAAIAKKAVETAVGLQSSMEQTLKACLPEANTLRLAVGVDMGITLVSKLGARGQRDRICLGEAVEDAARYEERCAGGQIGVSKRINDAIPDCLRNHFTYSIAARCFVATDLTVDKVERATKGVQRYQGGGPVYVQTGAAGVRISSQESPNARSVIPPRPYAS